MASKDQKQRSELVRQAILDTALEIGMKEGFEALSVRKIISKMRYSTGVVYHHFQDKQEIIDAIEASEMARMRDKISGILDESKDIAQNMAAVFHEIMLLAFHEPERYNLIVLHKYSRRTESRPQWIEYIGKGLEKGMREGVIRGMDAERAAFSIWSSFLGFNLMLSRQSGLAQEEAEALFQTQLEIVLKGVLHHE